MSEAIADAAMSFAMRGKLEQRLQDWAGNYLTPQRIGMHDRNILQTLIEHQGFVPSVRMVPSPDKTLSDQVEDVVLNMRRVGWWLHAGVLRLEYWRPALPMEAKLDRLKVEMRVAMNRRDYYRKLDEGKMWIAAALFG